MTEAADLETFGRLLQAAYDERDEWRLRYQEQARENQQLVKADALRTAELEGMRLVGLYARAAFKDIYDLLQRLHPDLPMRHELQSSSNHAMRSVNDLLARF